MSLSRFGSLRIFVPPGVYAPRRDTALLAGEIGPVEGASVLELCAGSGALALTAALGGAARVLAVDCSLRAVWTTRGNAWLNRLGVEARHGDLWDALRPGERFDVILANPPYLPALGVGRNDDRWDAGPDGRAVLDRIIEGASAHLRAGGRLILAQSALASITQTTASLRENELEVIRSIEQHGPFGPIVAARRESLVRRGTITADDAEETLAVLTAAPPTSAAN